MVSTYQARWLVAALLMINVAAAFTADAQPQCTLPADPGTLPQGASATQAQMLDAQQRIRDFNFLTEQYLRCVRSETDQAQLGKDAATREQLMSERIVAHNAAQAKLMGYAN